MLASSTTSALDWADATIYHHHYHYHTTRTYYFISNYIHL